MVARGEALRLGFEEWNHHPALLYRAEIAIRKLRCAQVPARMCRDRRFDEGMPDAGDVVADVVHLGHQHPVLAHDHRDHVVDDPAVAVHTWTEVTLARRVEDAVVGDRIPGGAGRDARKPSTFMFGGDERLFVDARHTAPRRLCSFARPSVQRDEQGARDRAVMKRIRELLALSVSDSTSRRYSWTVLHTREEVPANVLRLGEIPGPIF